MQISKKSQYGLRAMICLARAQKEKKIVSLKEITRKEKVPFAFVEKIMGQLEKAKLVKAKKGVQGGYFLAKPADKITPGDIVLVLEENITLVHCAGCSMVGSCSSEDVWAEAQQSLDSTLNATTLADLIEPKKKKK
ncbi:Rrf2 family transcriptional regulator [Patescibacteria group bacterium]|nr:Rrf2 family transcriptional regulator [Patescibacteria group bacterium]